MQTNKKNRKERYKTSFKKYQATISMILSVLTILLVITNMMATNLQIENYKHNINTQLQYEGIAVSIVRESEPNDPNPEIIDIPEHKIPTKYTNSEEMITGWVYHHKIDLVNMTNDYKDIWLKIYVPNLVYKHFSTIKMTWTALDNKLEEKTGILQKSDFMNVDFMNVAFPVTGYIASVNTEFETVIWRDWYTGPISVDIELRP